MGLILVEEEMILLLVVLLLVELDGIADEGRGPGDAPDGGCECIPVINARCYFYNF